jgi:di/tricarboxylate transporter
MVAFVFAICLSLMVTQLIEPLQRLKKRFNLLYPDEQKTILKYFIVKVLNCSKCFGFWFSLIFFKSFVIAVIVAVVTEIVQRNLMRLKIN